MCLKVPSLESQRRESITIKRYQSQRWQGYNGTESELKSVSTFSLSRLPLLTPMALRTALPLCTQPFAGSIKHLNLQGFLSAGTESQSVNPTCPPKNSLQVRIDGKWDTFPTSRVDHSQYPKSLPVALSWSSDSGHVFIGRPVLSPILSSFPTPSLVLPRIIYQIN